MKKRKKDNSNSKIFGSIDLIQAAYDRGHSAAKEDFAQGHGKLYFQIRGSWGRFFADLMRDRYGITVEHSNDITSEAQLSFELGYNHVAHQYIDSTHGEGTMDKIREEVATFRKASYRKFFDENPDIERPRYYQ